MIVRAVNILRLLLLFVGGTKRKVRGTTSDCCRLKCHYLHFSRAMTFTRDEGREGRNGQRFGGNLETDRGMEESSDGEDQRAGKVGEWRLMADDDEERARERERGHTCCSH